MTRPPQARTGKRPTLQDVADRAGVSRALVSIVIRGAKGAGEQTRERVLRAAREIGYRPDARASLLRRSRSRLLGVQFGLRHTFHADVVEGIYAAAEPLGYDIALSAVTPGRGEQRAVDALLADRCEALLLVGAEAPAARLAELAQRLPVVSVARRVREGAVDVVRSADDQGIREAVAHLAGLGHRRIAHIDGGTAPGAPADRRRGFRTAMRRCGLADDAAVVAGGAAEEDGAAAARLLLARRPRPTAVVAFNDRCATGVLDAFLRAGVRVPEDVSVVGYDDTRLARLSHVNLTTVAQDIPSLARQAVERAVARLDGDDSGPADVVIAPRLVVRGTTAPPAATG